MKHYKKDGKIYIEWSPLELMTKCPKAWRALPSEVQKELLFSPHALIRATFDGKKFSFEYET